MAVFQSKQRRSRVSQLIEVLDLTVATVSSVLRLRTAVFFLMRSRLRLAFRLIKHLMTRLAAQNYL